MLIWVCALHCEAKPVIDLYRLKKSHDDNAFDLYRGDNMACIVSGTGKVASAAACAWIAARHSEAASLAWINLGIAGSADHEIGSAFLLNQVIDADTGQRYYPVACLDSNLPGHACLTLSQADETYQPDYLYDMEASGFMYAALRFSSAETTQSIKIISDNRQFKTGKKRPQVSALIQQNIELIERQANQLITLDNELGKRAIPVDSWQRLIALNHFSQTQKARLRVLWRYLLNRNYCAERILHDLHGSPSGSAVIETLEQLRQADSELL